MALSSAILARIIPDPAGRDGCWKDPVTGEVYRLGVDALLVAAGEVAFRVDFQTDTDCYIDGDLYIVSGGQRTLVA